MAKNCSKDGFTKVPNWFFECGLKLIEVMILSRIASWQREDKRFFESKQKMSQDFKVSHRTLARIFKSLEERNIIKSVTQVGRATEYTINESTLNNLWALTNCQRTPDTMTEGVLTQSHRTPDTSTNYNTNNTSNKTSVREEGAFSAPSSEPKSALKPNGINNLALEQFINELNED